MTDEVTAASAQAGPGAHMRAELESQPDIWERALGLAAERELLPKRGERVLIVGCGTSWFIGQAYAALREQSGHGLTDAFTASEAPQDRDYDVIIALTRSGTTTEVIEFLTRLRERASAEGTTQAGVPMSRTLAIVGDLDSPVPGLVDATVGLPFADEQSVVQTRFATTALQFLRSSIHSDDMLAASVADARRVLADPVDESLLDAEQFSFLGMGWCLGIAHEAALKLRESNQHWTESYQSMEYRHGPISIAAPGRVTWQFGEAPEGLDRDVAATGARFENEALDPVADLVRLHRLALERAVRHGLDPDSPRSLTRSVILDA